MFNEMSHCICLVVTSCLAVLVIFMLYRCLLSPVSSKKLEGSSVMCSVVDKLFVEFFNGVFLFIS